MNDVDLELELPEQMTVRREKRARLLDEGRQAYPVGLARTATIPEIRARYGELPTDTATGEHAGKLASPRSRRGRHRVAADALPRQGRCRGPR